MNAIVLAAGTGTRLQPLTNTRPKAMLPIGEKPLLEHIVEALHAAGIDDIVLVVGHKRERIQAHFENGADWGVDIQYVTQEHPRGTGDALLQAEHTVGEGYLVINGDRIVEPEVLDRLIDRYRETGAACLAVTEVEDPTQYGAVDVEGDEVTDITEKPDPYEVTSNLVNAGVYAFGPEIFAAIRQTEHRGELKLTDTLRQYLDSHPLHAVYYDGLWLELSRPWDLLSASNALLADGDQTVAPSATIDDDATVGESVVVGHHARVQPGARIVRDVVVGDNVTIGANAVVTNAVVLEDAVIKPGAVVTDCIVGSGSTIGPLTSIEGGYGDVHMDDSVYPHVKFGGLIGDNVVVGGNVTVSSGTIIGNNVTVHGGATLTGEIPDGTRVFNG